MSGGRPFRQAGPPMVAVAGFGKTGMAGLGLAAKPGVGRLIIMDAGFGVPTMVGSGIPESLVCATTGRRRWSDSSVLAAELVLASALVSVTSVGFHWRPTKFFIPGGAGDS